MGKIEIEQKFLYKYIPFNEMKFYQKTVVYRKYISKHPEVRINKRMFEDGEIRCHITLKDEEYFSRNEIKIKISLEQYEQISLLIGKQELIIDIYEFIIDENHNISFKECRNLGISFAEVEYLNKHDYENLSSKIMKLPFISEDVTFDKNYYVRHIWEKYIDE